MTRYAVVLVALGGLLSGCQVGDSTDQRCSGKVGSSSPEQATVDFFEAVSNEDAEAVCGLVDSRHTEDQLAGEIAALKEALAGETIPLSAIKVGDQGSSTLNVTVSATSPDVASSWSVYNRKNKYAVYWPTNPAPGASITEQTASTERPDPTSST